MPPPETTSESTPAARIASATVRAVSSVSVATRSAASTAAPGPVERGRRRRRRGRAPCRCSSARAARSRARRAGRRGAPRPPVRARRRRRRRRSPRGARRCATHHGVDERVGRADVVGRAGRPALRRTVMLEMPPRLSAAGPARQPPEQQDVEEGDERGAVPAGGDVADAHVGRPPGRPVRSAIQAGWPICSVPRAWRARRPSGTRSGRASTTSVDAAPRPRRRAAATSANACPISVSSSHTSARVVGGRREGRDEPGPQLGGS